MEIISNQPILNNTLKLQQPQAFQPPTDLTQEVTDLITSILVHKFDDIRETRDYGRKIVKLLKSKKWKSRHNELVTLFFDQNQLTPQLKQILKWYSHCQRQKPLRPLKKLLLTAMQFIKTTRRDEFNNLVNMGLDHWKDVELDDLEAYFDIFPIKDKIKQKALKACETEIGIRVEQLSDIKTVIDALVQNQFHDLAFELILDDKQNQKFFIDTLIKYRNNNLAAQYANCFGFNLHEFPKLLEQLKKKAIFFLAKDPWYVVEDKLKDEPNLLKYFVRVKYLNKNSTAHIGYSILWRLNPYKEKPEGYIENPLITKDSFCPAEEALDPNSSQKYIRISDFVHNLYPTWVDSTNTSSWEDIEKELLSAKVIAFDSEWKFVLTKYEEEVVSIVQVATETSAYIFDILKLSKDPKLQNLLQKIFSSQEIIKIAHSPMGDIGMISKALFGNKDSIVLNKCLDVALIYRFEYKTKSFGLSNMCKKLFGKPLSKFEQQSNWNARPLRKTQLHYAALDAIVLIQIYKIFQKSLENVDLTKYYNDQLSDEIMEILPAEELLEEAAQNEKKLNENDEEPGIEVEGEEKISKESGRPKEKATQPKSNEERKEKDQGDRKNKPKFNNNNNPEKQGSENRYQMQNEPGERNKNFRPRYKKREEKVIIGNGFQVIYVPKETNKNGS